MKSSIEYILNSGEYKNVLPIAKNLKSDNQEETVWKILKWLEANIEYDFAKASLPSPVILKYSDGKTEISQGREKIIYTPLETVQKGSGICTDYSLLTLSLLLLLDFDEVYLLELRFSNQQIGHSAIMVYVSGFPFILDQHTPPMDPGSYYKHEYYYDKREISQITYYKIQKKQTTFTISEGKFSLDSFKSLDYVFTTTTLKNIEKQLQSLFQKSTKLAFDQQLEQFLTTSKVPQYYKSLSTYTMTFDFFTEYYNPIFNDQLLKSIIDYAFSLPNLSDNVRMSLSFYLTSFVDKNSLVVKVVFGKK